MSEGSNSSYHPPLPPTTEEDRFNRLRLLRSRRVGVATYHRLIRDYGTAQNALEALPEVAREAGVKGYEICPEGVIHAELKAARAVNAQLLCLEPPTSNLLSPYPSDLAQIADAPPLLWAVGELSLLTRPMVAMVGARNASSLGTRMARALAKDLSAAGCVVVSGLARGIDTAAHLTSLESGTIAVVAGGVDVTYPLENAQLAENIAKTGLILSEQPMGQQPMARHFPARNRIISGLSRAVVVVEAAAKSGSLITARDALDQGREVMAVPGHPMDARASGCNILIRDGALLVRSGEDVLDALPNLQPQPELPLGPPSEAAPKAQPRPKRTLRETANLHAQILSRLGPSPVSEDQLIHDLRRPASKVTPALTDLELDGKVHRQSGGFLSLVPKTG
jgi:DNA processing protein